MVICRGIARVARQRAYLWWSAVATPRQITIGTLADASPCPFTRENAQLLFVQLDGDLGGALQALWRNCDYKMKAKVIMMIRLKWR